MAACQCIIKTCVPYIRELSPTTYLPPRLILCFHQQLLNRYKWCEDYCQMFWLFHSSSPLAPSYKLVALRINFTLVPGSTLALWEKWLECDVGLSCKSHACYFVSKLLCPLRCQYECFANSWPDYESLRGNSAILPSLQAFISLRA